MISQIHNKELILRDTLASGSIDTALALTAAGGSYTRPDEAVSMPAGATYVELFFWGTDAANEFGDVNIYGWAEGSQNPPVYFLGEWTITLGTQVATALPWGDALTSGLYVDTIKMAEIVPTLPRDDAQLLDTLMEQSGVSPIAKQASSQDSSLSTKDLRELAELR